MLVKPQNQHLIRKIRASITAGVRPSVIILHERNPNTWTAFDSALVEAYQILQDEQCPLCGHPVWECRTAPMASGYHWKVKTDKCRATYALEEYKDSKRPKDQKTSKEDKKEWGVYEYTTRARLPQFSDEPEEEYPRRKFLSDLDKQ